METTVTQWFGKAYSELHPFLQKLHRSGGSVAGVATLTHGRGLAAIIGKRVGAKLGLPAQAGEHNFRVNISHPNGQLHWAREFNNGHTMVSEFEAHGQYPTGFWRESTGAFTLDMGVDTSGGGWRWVQRRVRLGKVPIPLFLFPKTRAYKRIENDCYVFAVDIRLPLLGQILRYGGTLNIQP